MCWCVFQGSDYVLVPVFQGSDYVLVCVCFQGSDYVLVCVFQGSDYVLVCRHRETSSSLVSAYNSGRTNNFFARVTAALFL